VIADNAIAACIAAGKLGFISGVARIAGINKVRKDGSITVIDSGNTGGAEHGLT
jgi:hypothetical protein